MIDVELYRKDYGPITVIAIGRGLKPLDVNPRTKLNWW
jgi:hypothetical protein